MSAAICFSGSAFFGTFRRGRSARRSRSFHHHRQPDGRFVFRVPSLRNVAVTAPYFHDGRAQTLEQAVEEMARSQLGRVLTAQEIGLIAGFLHLTGEYRGHTLSDRAGSSS